MRRLLVAMLAVSLIGGAVAWSYWSVAPAAGGTGAAAATTVNAGATPTASASGGSVTVSWSATALANGQAVSGYLIRRYDAVTSAQQTILSACTGTVAATTCTENIVPTGSWRYTVTPVIGTSWRGAESALSSVVDIDATPPTNALSLSSVTGGASLTGNTVYYRGAAAGSFRVTNAVIDAHSGPASSTTGNLSGTTTGFTHTGSTVSTPSGGPFVSDVFSWTAATTSSPQVVVTGRDVKGNSAAATLTLANDPTAPTASVDYVNGATTGRSVSVTFSASDSASGVVAGSARLQRAGAPLTNGTCGTFGGFVNIGSAAPTSPYADTNLSAGRCYKYQYVVSDKVGNTQTATSTNVAKVDYATSVSTTPGLLSQWRFGEPVATLTSSDSFTGASGTLLTNRVGEVGAAWAFQGGSGNTETLSSAGRVYRSGSGYTRTYSTATPASANYSVEADLYVTSNLANEMVGVIGRLDVSSTSYYLARWQQADASWRIGKVVNGGAVTYPGYVVNQGPLVPGQAYRVRLEMVGTSLKLYVNGVLTVTATDTAITAPGKAGIIDGSDTATVTKSATTGVHLDNFQVTPPTYPRAADSKGSNPGDYENGPTLGQAGALAGDSNTAARFDGVNDHVQVTNSTGLPAGAGVRSIEAWIKTTSTARQVLFGYGSVATSQQFALWLDAGGGSMTAWGSGTGNDKVFALANPLNDGRWHHVVQTYDGTSLTIYIDGVALPSQQATRNTVMDRYGFGIGAIINPSDGNSGGYFNGWMDEVAFYTSVLSQATVTEHFQLGGAVADQAGPTGGSVDASGLAGTGSRWSTSTTLSLVLAKGTDPSGVAATGAELRRSSAPLTTNGTTEGACGTFTGYAVVASDPPSPATDPVADQACYRYEYQVADGFGNTSVYTSPNIKVDTTPPAPPVLTFSSFINTYWSGTGSTVYYRSGAASGEFQVAATTSDPTSGISVRTFPQLGTGWTAALVGANVKYSWSTPPSAPGTRNVTATNNAGGVSANAPFTPTADGVAPSGGTLSYADGGTSNTTVSVSFTAGTDSESGLGTRLLQRASAPLTGSTCGTFTTFATVTGGTNPGSPFADPVTRNSCYQYRYLVSDNVGNQQAVTSANVVKVWPTYLSSVSTSTSLVNQYRLGEATTSSDSFTGATGALLQNRTGEMAAAWTRHPASSADATITAGGRVRKAGTSTMGALYYASGVPATADYIVETDIYVATNLTNDMAGVVGRLDTTNVNGTYYYARYEQTTQVWILYKVVNGTWTWLGQSATQALTVGSTYRLALDMTGASIRVLVDGVQVVAVTDAGIGAAGRGGLALGFHGASATTVTDTTGMHLDNFRTTPAMVDAKGTNSGDYLSGPVLGVAGAIAGDASTAAQFDGVNDFASVNRQVADDFSIEFWFKSTQGIGTGTQWWQGAGLVDAQITGSANDFGVSLRADGRVVAGVGTPDVSIVSTTGGYNNGAWHHVVFTRTRASGALALYVDGAAAGSATGSTLSLTSASAINFGRLLTGTNYYAGVLDEVAVYNTALTPGAIAAHYGSAQ
ncbi:MAG: LamG domain-containing protein [Nocardioides sp.]|nr:LamG domain-containing protein [Nocardioides sp.]